LELTIDQFIQEVVKEKHPNTVQELALLVKEKFSISEEEALSHIMKLTDKSQLSLKEHPVPLSYGDRLFSAKGLWFWSTIGLALATGVAVFMISENAFPLAYVRNLVGAVFMMFLPGFCLIKALFPRKELGGVERGALSVLGSLAIVALTSLVLNFTSYGITVAPMTIGLLVQTIVFAIVGLLREHGVQFEGPSE
jgi:hypothetical protein